MLVPVQALAPSQQTPGCWDEASRQQSISDLHCATATLPWARLPTFATADTSTLSPSAEPTPTPTRGARCLVPSSCARRPRLSAWRASMKPCPRWPLCALAPALARSTPLHCWHPQPPSRQGLPVAPQPLWIARHPTAPCGPSQSAAPAALLASPRAGGLTSAPLCLTRMTTPTTPCPSPAPSPQQPPPPPPPLLPPPRLVLVLVTPVAVLSLMPTVVLVLGQLMVLVVHHANSQCGLACAALLALPAAQVGSSSTSVWSLGVSVTTHTCTTTFQWLLQHTRVASGLLLLLIVLALPMVCARSGCWCVSCCPPFAVLHTIHITPNTCVMRPHPVCGMPPPPH